MPTQVDGKTAYYPEELFPNISPDWLAACCGAINAFNDYPAHATPVFVGKKHFLAETCGANALGYIEDELTDKQREFCQKVIEYCNTHPESEWDISHINLEE